MRSASLMADEQHLISGSNDGTVCVWDITTHRLVHKLTGHSKIVTAVACSPDGLYIVSGSLDNTIRLWDPSAGAAVTLPLDNTWRYSGNASADGRLVVSFSQDREAHIVRDGQPVATINLEGSQPYDAPSDVSPDGKFLASSGWNKNICLWDLETHTLVQEIACPDFVGNLVFSPDGHEIAAVFFNGTVRVLSLDPVFCKLIQLCHYPSADKERRRR
ncbi:WD40 repeat-like protein [Auricularia subglabra TFB-10046 SS5]|nr:WD40 repeat-like protein [Auricularia subglabra TFB-10046 SS5]